MKTKLFTVLLCLIVMACNKPKKYKVDFIKDEVSVHTQLVEHGQLIAKPQTIVYNDSVTYDWYSDNNPYKNQWDFDVDVVTQDTTLYALDERKFLELPGIDSLQIFPVETSFTEYSLSEISCQWKDFESNKVIIINSDEELSRYIDCIDKDYPKIDFSKHSLLLVRGRTASGIRNIDISLLKERTDKYNLNLLIYTDLTTVAPPWFISIVTPKINNKIIIVLNVQQIKD